MMYPLSSWCSQCSLNWSLCPAHSAVSVWCIWRPATLQSVDCQGQVATLCTLYTDTGSRAGRVPGHVPVEGAGMGNSGTNENNKLWIGLMYSDAGLSTGLSVRPRFSELGPKTMWQNTDRVPNSNPVTLTPTWTLYLRHTGVVFY